MTFWDKVLEWAWICVVGFVAVFLLFLATKADAATVFSLQGSNGLCLARPTAPVLGSKVTMSTCGGARTKMILNGKRFVFTGTQYAYCIRAINPNAIDIAPCNTAANQKWNTALTLYINGGISSTRPQAWQAIRSVQYPNEVLTAHVTPHLSGYARRSDQFWRVR